MVFEKLIVPQFTIGGAQSGKGWEKRGERVEESEGEEEGGGGEEARYPNLKVEALLTVSWHCA